MQLPLTIVGYETEGALPPGCDLHDVLARREWVEGELFAALRALAAAHRDLTVHVALRYRSGRKSVARVQGGRMTPMAVRGAIAAMFERLTAARAPRSTKNDPRAAMTTGTLEERTLAVKTIVRQMGARAIKTLLEVIDDETDGRDPDLRACIYEALSWHQTDEVHERFVGALRDEPDAVVAQFTPLVWRQRRLTASLPAMLSAAWRAAPRDERHVSRLVTAVRTNPNVELSDHWLASHDPELLERLGRTPPGSIVAPLVERIDAALDKRLVDFHGYRALCAAIDDATAAERDDARIARELPLMDLCNRSSARVRALAVELLVRLGMGRFRLAALSAGLPRTGGLRDALADDRFDTAEPAWSLEGRRGLAIDLPTLGRVLLCGEAGIALCGAGGPIAALDDVTAPLPGVVSAADAEAAVYICADGATVRWVRATADSLDVIGSVGFDTPVEGVVALADGALVGTRDGDAHVVRHGERVATLSAADSAYRVVAAAGGDADTAYLFGGGLSRIDADGSVSWHNPHVEVAACRFGTPLVVTPSGLWCAGPSVVTRLAIDSGAIVETHAVPLTPAGLQRDGGGVLALDGATRLGEPIASGVLVRPNAAPATRMLAPLAHRAARRVAGAEVELCRRGLIVTRGGAERLVRVAHPVRLGPGGAGVALVRTDGRAGPWLAFDV